MTVTRCRLPITKMACPDWGPDLRIGILADIHGDFRRLELAIQALSSRKVDRYIALGDLLFNRQGASETVSLLKQVGAAAVWGNHELGLCVDPRPELLDGLHPDVVDYFSGLVPDWELSGCLFSHTFPNLDPTDPLAFYLGSEPESAEAREVVFAEFSHRVFAIGHFHRWYAANREGPLDWQADRPLQLRPAERYFFVIAAVKDGRAAVLDLNAGTLEPVNFP